MFLYAIFVLALSAIMSCLKACSIVLFDTVLTEVGMSEDEMYNVLMGTFTNEIYNMSMLECKILVLITTFGFSYALNKSYMLAFIIALVMFGLEFV